MTFTCAVCGVDTGTLCDAYACRDRVANQRDSALASAEAWKARAERAEAQLNLADLEGALEALAFAAADLKQSSKFIGFPDTHTGVRVRLAHDRIGKALAGYNVQDARASIVAWLRDEAFARPHDMTYGPLADRIEQGADLTQAARPDEPSKPGGGGGAMSESEMVRILAKVAATNPDALRLAAQLLGAPACPRCDFVMRANHICAARPDPKGGAK